MKNILFVLILALTPLSAFADATSTATITIRDGSITAFTGTVELAATTTPPVDIAPTNSTTAIAVPADSLLATLVALDATTTDFDITDLAYFSSFNSFIINCITVSAASTTPHCFNWTYAVNGSFPQTGVDHHILQNGDVVYLFFGPSRQTILSTTTAIIDEQFTATAQSYDLASGSYVSAPGLTLGVGTPNPDFSFTELATSTSGANGEAIFSLHATGTFAVGIAEDFYFPSASITIADAPATTTDEVDVPPPSSDRGGGGGGPTAPQFNVGGALAYLVSNQHADGSFDSPLLTDWAALAFAASDPGTPKTLLRNYLLAAVPALSSATDFERHAMALQALGINPYSDTPVDYIAQITNKFDGTQIGDVHLDNDDIFALFPLLRAGYETGDDIIQKTTAFIVSRQLPNGSWDSSIDVTAAAVQALSQVKSLPDVASVLTKAENYLHSQQQANGDFSNSFSTSWALQAVAALNQAAESWAPAGLNPKDYLISLQQSDGGIESMSSDAQTRQWATEYAIPAILGKTWPLLLSSFGKPANVSGSGTVLGASTSTLSAATSTPVAATSTSATATSTPPAQIATSTPAVATTQNSTTTKPAPAKPKIQKTKPTAQIQASTTQARATSSAPLAQTAAVAEAAPRNSFFGTLWHSIVSFFRNLF